MLSILLNPVTLVCLCFCPLDLALISLLGLRGASDRGMCGWKGSDHRKTFLPSANNFMTHNALVFSEHDFAASNATGHDVVGDEIETNIANPPTLIVENQHINPPEEPEHMANVDYDSLKKPVCVFFQTIA
ncbi:hypothetical protein TNCV_468721 [Trichonephila clavipes]|nr:hypothetical protein TNCV_468721 [Trichonephila clavipes]